MRIASALHGDRALFGLVVDDSRLADLSNRFDHVVDLLATTVDDAGRAEVVAATGQAPVVELDQALLLAPIPEPQRILCVGTNYNDHVAESDRVIDPTEKPMIFTRFASSLVAPGQPIVRPAISTAFDYEGELAVVIGRHVHRADQEQARAAIGGYACFLDGTLRDYQRHTSQFTPGKTADRTGSWGPLIVTADEVPDPYRLRLTTSINGDVVQEATTDQLIFDLEAIVSYCSMFMALRPGDVIATGTPGGVGYARTPPRWLLPGDEVTVDITGVGALVNPVIDEIDL